MRKLIHQNSDLPQRIINVWSIEAQDQLIAEAIAIDDYLLVFSCAIELLAKAHNLEINDYLEKVENLIRNCAV